MPASNAVATIKVGGRVIPEEVVNSVWGFYSLYVLTALLLTGSMMGAGLDLESAFGATVASMTLLGPGLGEVASTFATVGNPVKWLAIFGMLVGRLEVFTLLVLFTPAFGGVDHWSCNACAGRCWGSNGPHLKEQGEQH